MADLTLTATVSSFPSGASYTVQQFANAFAQRLIITLPGTNVFFGQLGGAEPGASLPGNGATAGLWWDGTAIRSWSTDSSKYLPISPIAGNYSSGTLYKTTFLSSNVSSNTTLTAPADKSGTIALTSDIPVLIGTQTLTGTTASLDWSVKKPAYIVLSGNTTVNHAGQSDGQIQDLLAENNGTSYTLTINGTTWPANATPTMTTSTAGTRKIDRYRFINIGGTTTGALTFGQVLNNGTGSYAGSGAAYSITTASDIIPPTVSHITGVNKTANILVTFNKVLQGASLAVSDFIVKKAGVTQTILTATVNGMLVTLQLSGNLNTTSAWTIQYTGTSIKDLSGNAAAVFGPSTVVVSNSSGSESGSGGN